MKYCIVTKFDDEAKKIAEVIKSKINFEYDDINPKLVICVGGDGTTLSAIHQYSDKIENLMFISFNAGHLGFFSSFDSSEIDEFVKYIHEEKFTYDELNLIEYAVETHSTERNVGYAVNEITIVNPRRTLILDVYINNKHFEHYRGTGMCLSTSVGSTGYNKSLHGAVVLPSVEMLQMTEIASINSNLYHTLSSPLILSKNDVVELTSETNKELFITADSISLSFKDFKSIKVNLSNKKVKLINRNIDYIERIKKNFI